jgi:malonyl CoA-acyl carrier protein transacylase
MSCPGSPAATAGSLGGSRGGTAWLFPGQGTQRRGMGADLFGRYPGLVRRADDIVGYSMQELCLADPGGRLADTRYCQPALYLVNMLTFLGARRSSPWPDYVAGHSLGEYCALTAAGAVDFETGLRLVTRRAELMAQVAQGAMLAVIGPRLEELTQLMAQAGPDLEVANYNLPDQTVVSGPTAQIRALADRVDRDGLGRTVHLHVSGAFHSRLAAPAAESFAAELDQYDIGDVRVPAISNVTARPFEPGTVRRLMAVQMRRPVRWVEIMEYLRARGVAKATQVGPGSVLDGLWRRFCDSQHVTQAGAA